MGWAADEQPPQLVLEDAGYWPDFTHYDPNVSYPYELHAFNSFFEYCIWKFVLKLPIPPFKYWHDTMAKVRAMALPGSLAGCCLALGLPDDEAKNKRGRYLIQRLSVPQRNDKRNYDPDLLDEFYDYCLQDVVSERAVDKKVLPLNETEREIWILDQEINARGINVDLSTVNDALYIIDTVTKRMNQEVSDVTLGRIQNTNTLAKVKEYLADIKVNMPSMNKNDVSAMLEQDIPDEARVVLTARQQLGKTSLAKYPVLKRLIADDGRVHGLLQVYAAATHRWGGRMFQPHNLPRPSFADTDACVELIKTRDIDYITMMHDDPMEALSSCIRSMLIPGEGKTFFGGDFKAVEACGLSWLAEAEDRLEIFRTHGMIYEHTASQIYEVPLEQVTELQRFIGKVGELAMGYMGGGNAFEKMASVYDTRIYDTKFTKALGEKIKIQWRKNNPEIVGYWEAIEKAAIMAVQNSGKIISVRRMKEAIRKDFYYLDYDGPYNKIGDIQYVVKNNFLLCRAPSGSFISYYRPHLKTVTVYMFKVPSEEDPEIMVNHVFDKRSWTISEFKASAKEHGVEIISFQTPQLRFYGNNSTTRQWERQHTYGGKLTQNVCEKICRDVLAEAMLRVTKAGYDIVLTVHDEALSEAFKGSKEEFKKLMEVVPKWATGFPIVAKCYEATRYGKR